MCYRAGDDGSEKGEGGFGRLLTVFGRGLRWIGVR